MTDILDELEQHPVEEAIVRLIIKATEAQEILLDDGPSGKLWAGPVT